MPEVRPKDANKEKSNDVSNRNFSLYVQRFKEARRHRRTTGMGFVRRLQRLTPLL